MASAFDEFTIEADETYLLSVGPDTWSNVTNATVANSI